MSEGSLPPFGPFRLFGSRSSLGRLVKQTLGRFFKRPRGDISSPDHPLRARAASAIREYADSHPTLFERAARLRERAERLERSGTPSESARNRAERAREEVLEGLAHLRASFAASLGEAGARAFDREVERRYPASGVLDARR
jgi:hypothetical protein